MPDEFRGFSYTRERKSGSVPACARMGMCALFVATFPSEDEFFGTGMYSGAPFGDPNHEFSWRSSEEELRDAVKRLTKVDELNASAPENPGSEERKRDWFASADWDLPDPLSSSGGDAPVRVSVRLRHSPAKSSDIVSEGVAKMMFGGFMPAILAEFKVILANLISGRVAICKQMRIEHWSKKLLQGEGAMFKKEFAPQFEKALLAYRAEMERIEYEMRRSAILRRSETEASARSRLAEVSGNLAADEIDEIVRLWLLVEPCPHESRHPLLML